MTHSALNLCYVKALAALGEGDRGHAELLFFSILCDIYLDRER